MVRQPRLSTGQFGPMSWREAGRSFMNRMLVSARDLPVLSDDSLIFRSDGALPLDCGRALAPFEIAYQTYGALNADKSNAVLVCHGTRS